VTVNGLSLHGDPANRLEDTVADLRDELKEVNEMSQVCKDEGDMRGYRDLMKLSLDIRKDLAKYMGIEPEKRFKIEMTSAEETRKKMEMLFPTDDIEEDVEE